MVIFSGSPLRRIAFVRNRLAGLCPGARSQKVNGLAVLVHRTIQIPPLAFDPDVGFVHAPADPHGPFSAMERLFQLRAVFHHPALDGRMVNRLLRALPGNSSTSLDSSGGTPHTTVHPSE